MSEPRPAQVLCSTKRAARPDLDVSETLPQAEREASPGPGIVGPPGSDRDPRLVLGCIAALALTFLVLTYWSWRKWPDFLVDFGHQLYVPWRIAEGDVLYRDMLYIMGPLSQYFNAALFTLFGTSMTTLIVANLLILAVITGMIVWLVRPLLGLPAATFCGIFFLAVFGFSQYVGVASFNYVCPYRHEMTHGLLLILAMAVMLRLGQRGRGSRWWLGIGGCLGGMALLKTEISAVGLGLLGGCMLGAGVRDAGCWRRWGHPAALCLGGALLPIALGVGLLALELPLAEAIGHALTNWRLTFNPTLVAENPFYRSLSGFSDVAGNLRVMAGVLWKVALVMALAAALDRALGRRALPLPAQALVGALVGGLAWRSTPDEFWWQTARILPVVAVAVCLVASCRVWQARRAPQAPEAAVGWLLWGIVSGMLLLKVLLRVRYGHYGFVLAMPATLLFIGCWSVALPRAMAGWWGGGRLFRAVGLGLVVAAAVHFLQASQLYYRDKTLLLGRPGDQLYHSPIASPRHQLIPILFDYLRQNVGPNETLVVIPEGASLNYFLRARNPTSMYSLMPWELAFGGGEGRLIEQLAAARPDVILLLSISMAEYGAGFFGSPGYGDQALAWIMHRYRAQRTITVADDTGRHEFQAIILRLPEAD